MLPDLLALPLLHFGKCQFVPLATFSTCSPGKGVGRMRHTSDAHSMGCAVNILNRLLVEYSITLPAKLLQSLPSPVCLYLLCRSSWKKI